MKRTIQTPPSGILPPPPPQWQGIAFERVKVFTSIAIFPETGIL